MSSKKQNTHLFGELDKQIRVMSANSVLLSHSVAEKVGIHPTDLECVDFLYLYGDLPAGKLATLTGLTTGAITAVIDRLEKKGFVKRKHDKNDRRKIIVMLNKQKTDTMITSHYLTLGSEMNKLYKHCTSAQIKTLLTFITKANAIAAKEIANLKY